MINNRRNGEGITLIALVITIILLLVLAGIAISMANGNNGILNKAVAAKNKTGESWEKEQISLALTEYHIEELSDFSSIDEEKLQKILDKNVGENKTEVIDDDKIYVRFIESNNYYEIDGTKKVDLATLEEKTLTIKCKNSKGAVLKEEQIKSLLNKYKIKDLPQIDGYMSSKEVLEGRISEGATVNLLYYQIIPEDNFVFTGLDENGNITEDESQIVSYMIGDGSTTAKNGLKNAITITSALIIPNEHNGKPVTKIGGYSFKGMTNLAKIVVPDNVKSLGTYSLWRISTKTIEIGRGLTTIGQYCFWESGCDKIIWNNEIASLSSELSFSEIEVNNDNKVWKVKDKILLCKIDGKSIVRVAPKYTGEIVVDDIVERIESYAFNGSRSKKIVLGKNVKSIGQGAFGNAIADSLTINENISSVANGSFWASSIKKIIYNNEKKVIENGDFWNNYTACKSIEISDENTVYKAVDNVVYSKNGEKLVKVAPSAYQGEFKVDSGVKEIINNAFLNCSKIKTIILDSETIAKNISSATAAGKIGGFATTIYIKDTIPDSSINNYIKTNYTLNETSDKTGYSKYTK